MKPLYELVGQHADALRQIEDLDGEVTDDLEAVLRGLEGEINDKIDSCCKFIRHMLAEADMLKAEADRLNKRRATAEAKAERIKQYLAHWMHAAGLKTAGRTLKATATMTPAAVLVEDEAAIPADYWKAQPPKLDRAGLRDALKAGVVVPGVKLEQKETVRIK